jgi:peptidoglycan/LPS O-acetylase OafA/YrhL
MGTRLGLNGPVRASKIHSANNMDFMRLVAALSVLVSHCYPIFGQPFDLLQHWTGWLTLGGVAVDVFFIMSGFLIAQSWTRDPNALRFLRNRALRILPALYVLILVSFLLAGPLLTELPLSVYFARAQVTDMLAQFGVFWLHDYEPGVFVHSVLPADFNGSLWTIPLEVLCYLMALALGVAGLFSNRWTVTAVAAATFGLYFYCTYLMPVDHIVLNMPVTQIAGNAAYFFAGSSLFLWWPKLPTLHGAYALIGLAILLATGGFRMPVTLHLVLPFLIMSMAFHPTRRLSKFGKRGDYSYGIYLYAFPVGQCVMSVFGPAVTLPGLIVVSAAVTMVFAVLSWHFVESPSLSLKRTRTA